MKVIAYYKVSIPDRVLGIFRLILLLEAILIL